MVNTELLNRLKEYIKYIKLEIWKQRMYKKYRA